MGIADRRIQYETAGLDVDDLLPNPVDLLLRWYHQAEEAGAAEPNAMVVSTLDEQGHPDARVVLARGISTDRQLEKSIDKHTIIVMNDKSSNENRRWIISTEVEKNKKVIKLQKMHKTCI